MASNKETTSVKKRTTKTANKTLVRPDVETSSPTYEQIAQRAYFRFLGRGCRHGNDVSDWLAAEAELQQP